jgi:hypothetical protein
MFDSEFWDPAINVILEKTKIQTSNKNAPYISGSSLCARMTAGGLLVSSMNSAQGFLGLLISQISCFL